MRVVFHTSAARDFCYAQQSVPATVDVAGDK